MKKPKNIERIKYLAYHHKRARVRKKNLKRLQKYGVVTFNLKDIAEALNNMVGKIVDAFRNLGSAFGQALKSYPQDPPRIVDNVDRCLICGIIIPEGRQVCPNCERSVEQWTSQNTEKEY